MGGGFVMIPLMTSPLLRLSQHQAHGTSLFAVAATGISGAAAYKDFVQLDTALAVAIPAMLTARLGAKATAVLSERYLKRALGLLLLIMGPAVPLKAHLVSNMQQNETTTTKDTKSTDTHNSFHHLIPAALIGVFSGFLSGIFGVGGGTIVVPALAIFSSNEITSHHAALGTSLAAMTLPAAVGTYTHWTVGNLVLRSAIAPALAMGALFGANVGGTYAIHLPESKLQWGFSSLLTVLGIRTLLRA